MSTIPLTTNKAPLSPLSREEQRELPYFVRQSIEHAEQTAFDAGYGRTKEVVLVSQVGSRVQGAGGRMIECENWNFSVTCDGMIYIVAVQTFPGREARPWFSVTVDDQEQLDALGQVDPGLHLGLWTEDEEG